MKRRATFDFGCFVWTMDCVPALFVCFVLFVCFCFSAFSVSFSALAFQFPLCVAFIACFLFFHCLFGSPLFRFGRLYIYLCFFLILLCVLFWCPLFLYVSWFSLFCCCTLPADSTWRESLPFLWRARKLSIMGFVFIHYHSQFNWQEGQAPIEDPHIYISYLLIRIDIPITRIPIWWCCLQLKSWSVWWWSWSQVEATNLGHM